MNETPICIRLIGMTLTEAVGTILREGMNFRIVKEDDKEFYNPDPSPGMVNLTISDRKISSAITRV